MEFCKMNGAGNDFIIIDNRNGDIPESKWPEIAKIVCERHLSVGADGLMVVENPDGDADFKMLFYNSDGSMGEMCGNGARCICRYGYEHGIAGETQTIETTAGIVTGERIDKLHYRVRLNDPSIVRLDLTVHINDMPYLCSYVELGNPGIPHVVVEIPDLEIYPHHKLFNLGRSLRYHPEFPKGANINFYEFKGKDLLYERTYERGVEDFTYACGTGTGSLVTVLTLKGLVSGNSVRVQMQGGELIIDAEQENGQIKNLYLTGPTNMVLKGTLTDDALQL
ncbi:MAG: diaminopimelate epimerase [Lachnospiraceae bacterium]|nr:diaminopimelate epimerase [Lachnospiraceae bacterium]MBQ5698612.1 diaminopimelate epimerase [Lachnospiraceae bacterium]